MTELHKCQEKHLYKTKTSSLGDVSTPGKCTFCGASLDEDERFCSECGNPREGIRCPKCGTLSHYNFCSGCNTPLNEMAHESLRQAKADPLFHRAEQLAEEMAQLEKQIFGDIDPLSPTLNTSVNNDAIKEAEHYASLFSDEASLKVSDVPKSENKPRSKVLIGDVLAKAQEAYKNKAAELQRTLEDMLPPPSATPEEQRNFFCARKITTVELMAKKQVWVCNYCGCHHNAPSECAKPYLGGTWLIDYVANEKTVILYE